MALTANTLHIFNKNLVNYASDQFEEVTVEKLGVIKLIASVLTQALDDLHNGTDKQQLDVDKYMKGGEFSKHCEMLSLNEALVIRMLINTDNTIIDYDSIINVYEDEDGVNRD